MTLELCACQFIHEEADVDRGQRCPDCEGLLDPPADERDSLARRGATVAAPGWALVRVFGSDAQRGGDREFFGGVMKGDVVTSSAIHTAVPGEAKLGFVTHRVPCAAMAGISDMENEPEAGDLVAVEVMEIGQHSTLESRESRRISIFPGDLLIGAFGNRYATDQFEGYVGERAEVLDILSVGGVCGQVRSQSDLMKSRPTRVGFRGYVCAPNGAKINLRTHALTPRRELVRRPETVLVVGASMNAGKTTTVANAVRGLHTTGYRVAAGKITGTACGKDTWLMHDAGALAILDFLDCGYPSTFLASLEELKQVSRTILGHLARERAEVVFLEIADGLFQRETRMLLTDAEFRGGIDHVLFAGGDSLSVESGVRILRSWGYRVVATSGLVSCSSLGIQEAEAAARLPCLSAQALAAGNLLPLIGLQPRSAVAQPMADRASTAQNVADGEPVNLIVRQKESVPAIA